MAAPGNAIYVKDGIIHLMSDRGGAYGLWILPFRGWEQNVRWLKGNTYSRKGDLDNNVLYVSDVCEGALLVNEDTKEAVFSPWMGYFDVPYKMERIWGLDNTPIALIFKHHWKEMIELNWPGWEIKVANKTDFAVHEHVEIDFGKIPELPQATANEKADFPLSKQDTYIYIARGLLFPRYFDELFEVSGTPEARIIKYKPEMISSLAKDQRTDARKRAEVIEYVLKLLLQ